MAHIHNDYKGAYNSARSMTGGLNVRTFVQLWILSTLVRVDEPMWGRAIRDYVRRSTRIMEGDRTIFDGYSIALGTIFGLLKEYRDAGYIEEVFPVNDGIKRNINRKIYYQITPTGREHLEELKQEYLSPVSGALFTLQHLVNQVYDANVLTIPLAKTYTNKQGDPNRII